MDAKRRAWAAAADGAGREASPTVAPRAAMERARENKPLRRKALPGGRGCDAPEGDGGGGGKKPKFVSLSPPPPNDSPAG